MRCWCIDWLCICVPHPTIFNYLSMALVWRLPTKNPLKASVPESRRVVEGISRDFRDHRSFGQSVDGRSDGECWTEPQFLHFFDIKLLISSFFWSCHVMSTESWCKVEEGIQVPLQGIIKHQQTAGFWEASFSRTGRRTSSKSVQCTGKTWKSPVPRIFFLHLRHVYKCACQHSLVFSFKVTLLYLKQWRYWKGLEKLAALPQTFMKISMCLDKFFRVESVDVPWKSYQM